MSTIFAITALAIAVVSPAIGVLMKRIGARRVLMIGIFAFTISLLAVSRAPNDFSTYLFLSAVLGLTGAATNTFVYISVLPQWFSNRLGLMLGLAMTGIGIGGTLTPVLSQALISEFGWRNAYVFLASLPMIVALPCVVFLIKERLPSALTETLTKSTETNDHPVGTFDVLKSKAFWALGVSFLVIATAASGVGLHTVPVLIDRGLSPMEAASIAAAGGVAVFVGRLGTGVLLDYVSPRIVGVAVFLAAATGPLLLTSYGPMFLLFLVPLLLGLAIGAEGDLMPYSVRNRFGLKNYSVIYGWLFLLFNVGVFLGPLLMGFYYDRTSGYDGMLIAISLAVLVSYPAFWWAIGEPELHNETDNQDTELELAQ